MKKMMFTLLICLITSWCAKAQELKTLTGHVTDDRGRDLKAATIMAEDSHTATVTNEDGDFILKIPSATETVTVSHMGYTSQVVNIRSKSDIKVRLHAKVIVLDEVLVGTPEDILALAIRNIPQNYLMEPSLQKCFYRETTRKGRRYIYVAEAVNDMYKTDYDNGTNGDKVAISKARRLISTLAKDTLGAKIAGGPVTPVILDIVKNQEYLLNPEHLSQYTYSMRPAPTSTNGRSEVIITITPKEEMSDALLWGDFYIDTQSLAIMHIDLQLDMNNRDKASEFMLQRKPLGVKFKPQELTIQANYRPDENGKLFLSYIRSDISFNCEWKRKLFKAAYHVTSEMVVTDIAKGKVKPIKGKSRFNERESLYDHPEYFGDPEFWDQFNIIAPTESLEKGIKRFMKKMK